RRRALRAPRRRGRREHGRALRMVARRRGAALPGALAALGRRHAPRRRRAQRPLGPYRARALTPGRPKPAERAEAEMSARAELFELLALDAAEAAAGSSAHEHPDLELVGAESGVALGQQRSAQPDRGGAVQPCLELRSDLLCDLLRSSAEDGPLVVVHDRAVV